MIFSVKQPNWEICFNHFVLNVKLFQRKKKDPSYIVSRYKLFKLFKNIIQTCFYRDDLCIIFTFSLDLNNPWYIRDGFRFFTTHMMSHSELIFITFISIIKLLSLIHILTSLEIICKAIQRNLCYINYLIDTRE